MVTHQMTTRDGVPVLDCPVCQATVPAAYFCGNCGTAVSVPVKARRTLLRPSAYAAARREPVWFPRMASTLLPRLPGAMRRPYSVGLGLILIVMVVLAVARVPGPLAVTAILGWPLLFVIYLWQTDVFTDLPRRILQVSALLGVVLGVGWWLLLGVWLADSYDVSTGSALMLRRVLNVGLLMTAGGSVLMLVPAVVTRALRVPFRESLDGFVLGAAGALGYLMASEMTIIGPQVTEGLVNSYSGLRLFNRAITHGVVSPIAATAAGGLVGMALWFRPRQCPGTHRRRARWALTLCALAAVPLYLGVWIVDALDLPLLVDGAVKLVMALSALMLIRCAVQIALLHEVADPAAGEPVLCVQCERVVPDFPFCAACGSAARATSRTSRRQRAENPPVRELAEPAS